MKTPDIATLLAPVSETDRAGPDLAYDPERHEIEQAFEASVSIDTDGSSVAAADIDWRRIIGAIAGQSTRTKDIWLAVYLCRAGARAGKLDIVEAGAGYLAGLIDGYWDDVHPRLEDYGVEGRTGACDTLVRFREFIGPLRGIALLEHSRYGSFNGGDLQRFQHGGEAEDGYSAFRATLDDAGSAERLAQAAAQLDGIATLFRSVNAALALHAGAGAGTSFAPLFQALDEIGGAARAFLPGPCEQSDIPAGEVSAGDTPTDSRGSGPVRSRDDVVRTIDSVIDYYRRAEPHSPVPLLLGRARAWVHRDFMEVLQDIAPAAVSEAQHLLHFQNGPE
ncbi:ImpA family type VI secretion system protein [Sphingomonas arantia]|uniref:ImpA family type VI secretion system protein n=1 Tax=Sphingomonas arantia TaxID=1460676 RepID=A0ABW4U0B0_9SPHN